ncbi:MAG: alpha/beta hydrolase [Gammaproteobacteria bacterium]|nr:alpha/beta hydrolase [Gammaproteobacteria bacterium]
MHATLHDAPHAQATPAAAAIANTPGLRTFTLSRPDGHRIFVYEWAPVTEGQPRGVLHICHGMGEHAQRYQRLARALNAAGWVVFAHDHRGHGRSIDGGYPGHYADQDGWAKVTSDVDAVITHIQRQHPHLPLVLLGHSMGSFIVQGYLMRHPAPSNLHGLVLSATNRDAPLRLHALGAVLQFERWRRGARGISPIIRGLTFETFAKSVKEARSSFDWLSKDPVEVRKYVNDRLCGFDCTVQLWEDLRQGLLEIHPLSSLRRLPAQLPMLFIAGERDPVGHFGQGPRALAKAYRKAGQSNITLNLYPDVRHEPFNEAEREQITRDLLGWLEKRIVSRG